MIETSSNFKLKVIPFFGKKIPILLQNENGPCPLLAICNVLLLQQQITIHTDYTEVTLEHLIQLVANRVFEANKPHEDEAFRANQQKQLEDLIEILPKLQYGLDVNVRFRTVTDFEFTQEMAAFDALGITLAHGWLVDPQDRETSDVVGGLSYNQLVERLITYRSALSPMNQGAKGTAEGFAPGAAVAAAAAAATERQGQVSPGATKDGEDGSSNLEPQGCIDRVEHQTDHLPKEDEEKTIVENMIEDLKLKNENQNHLEREVEPQKSDDDHINNKKMTNDAVNDTQSSAGMMDGFIQNPALIPDTQLGEKEKRNSSGGLIEVPGIDDILMHQQDGSQTTPLSRRMPSQRTQDLVDGAIIDRFMNNTSSQLTYFGLSELHGQLRERQFCVFFRNNHFCTLFKHEEKLYLLVTDLGYQHEYDVVWERFDEIDGDTEYVNGNFRNIQRRVEDTPGSLPEHIVDPDYLMAMQLQQGEDADVGGQARPPPEQARTADGTEISPPLIEDNDAALAARLHQEELAAAGAQGGAGQAAAALQQQPPPPAVTAAAAAADPSYPTREDGTPYSEAEVQAMIQQQLAYAQRRQQGGGGGGAATAAGGRSAGPYRPSAARNSRKKKDCTVQ